MTESTDSINTLIDSISDRLNILELIVSPTTLDASVRVPADNPSATIVGGLKDAQSNLKKELQKQLSLASFIQLYDSMEPLFTTRQLMPGTLPRNISNSTLKEMVLAADADLTEMADHLSAIDSLKNLIDIPSLSELPRLQPQLSAVESDLNQDVDRITRMHNQFTTNMAVSQLFLQYHYILAELEQKLSVAN
ncbi:hypothetical protein BATDEDRAFT_21232 [Batrachochytrium dendrobatidis JAM81]|uniref:Dynactin subunit 3 n=1 Tax=Batrachochytrium dendrobatidis (strain JAM81 / FGSC 10211) TaxID=684364 RepID=F4NRW5_BATDJ|nr:uncharacterized protein BATDEDRAFT_21232 [Batrachochytrium dendrobatidis JAM81]EGF83773.1 hypothetical protein BATDEDRAFT_21232 [Batrachochytrium dendrobatidis JAM81]|eukprot:XP_006675232.1 hypothetical protein BATDEDRAFT_21232 [Batrachochytrium dendrobatidis JAM81]